MWSPGRRSIAATEWAVVVAAGAFYASFILRSGLTIAGRTYYALVDDSVISMDYARNLAHGHGLVWHAGQHVEGYTNFLWTLWMGALQLLPLSDAAAGLPVMVSAAGVLILTMLVTRSICRALVPERRFVPVTAMALVGFCFPLVFWSLRGMEAGLGALLVALAVRLAIALRNRVTDRTLLALGGVLAAALLTRDDLTVPAIVIIAFTVRWVPAESRRRALALIAGPVVLTVAAHEAFRLAYYGDALPNTYYLKVGGTSLGTRLPRGLVALAYTGLTSLYAGAALAIAALVLGRRTRRAPALYLLGAVVAAEFLYSAYVGGDYAEELRFANRFIVTAAPLLLILAAIGISDIVHSANRRGRWLIAVGVPIAVLAALLQGHGWSATNQLEINGAAPFTTGCVAIAAAVGITFLWLGLSRGRNRLGAVVPAVLLFILALGALDYGAVREWGRAPIEAPSLNSFVIARSLILKRDTSPQTSVAYVEAGDGPYFSHREGVDLLGKADVVVAHGPNHPIQWKPGHTKWNYAYSIGKLRPDIVTELFLPSARDVCSMVGWGYTQLAPNFWVRSDARGVDVRRLSAEIRHLYRGTLLRVPLSCRTAGHS